jgi:diguanylate cyclase (GGDEF)-like protein/PAS domain S-box-containing protein
MREPLARGAVDRAPTGRSASLPLLLVLAFTAVVVVGAGVAGALRAADREHEVVVELLRAVVAAKTEHWRSWLGERRAEAEAQRADAALDRSIRQWRRAPDDAASGELQARLDQLCRPPRCLGAALLDASGSSVFQTGGSHAPAAGLRDLVARTQAGTRLPAGADTLAGDGTGPLPWQVAVPLDVGEPLMLALRFDARPVIERMLAPDDRVEAAGVRLVLTRRIDGALQQLEGAAAGGAPALRLASHAAPGPAAWTAGEPFEALDRQGESLLGVAAAPDDLGWAVAAYVEQRRVRERVWPDLRWIAVADLAALALAAAAIFSLRVTERRQQDERQRQWAKAFEATRDGVMIADARGRILTVNRAFSEITGYRPEEAIGQGPGLLRSGRHDSRFYRELWRTLNGAGHWGGEIWNRRKNGEVYPEWLTISAVHDEAGQVVNYVGVFTDMSRAKRDEAELQRLAHCDLLTELPNRRQLHACLAQALAHAQRHGGLTAVLSIDLDGFKTVNDSLGHPVGDELLIRIAERLKGRVRAEDTLGRLGGDEFLVILESLASPDDAATLAQDLLAQIAEPVALSGGREAYVTASIGICVLPDGQAGNATEMLRDADAALYRAKEQGRNRFCFFTQELNAQAVSKLETEAALSRALQRDELLLHYQPKVDAKSGRVSGAEALLRWRRQGKLVPPGRFIALAERSSLILDIGAWVIDRACRQVRDWSDRGLAVPRIAVNVGARQFAAGDLDRVVREALQRHGVPARLLELELTESMLIDDPQAAVAMLTRLKGIGVTLSLDDFGTGYSSLGYLRQFPIDALKIDKCFVDEIEAGPDGGAIVDAVIALAHRLDLAVVAEGVETPQQRAYLERQGCDQLQGYLVGRPMPAELFEPLMAGTAGLAHADAA